MICPGPDKHPAGVPVVYVVEERANPSTDYFVLPAVSEAGQRVVRRGFGDLPASEDLNDATVVFVRYVPSAWAQLVERERSRIRSLALFIDDDVLDTAASAGLPWRYRFKLARLAAWRSGWLRRNKAELWVSTPHLRSKYMDWRPRLLFPSPVASATDVCRVFYHGTASHGAEVRWLFPVVEEVLRRDERIVFEVVGGRDVYRLYRALPRVTVVHPMRWPAYQAFLAMPGRHIGLAPLLDTTFNRARACTKFFDITRCGAAGIYSANGACGEVVRHEREGLVVEQHHEAWIGAILRLAGDACFREDLARNAARRVSELAALGQREESRKER